MTWALLGSLLITGDFARAVAVTSARSSDSNANTNTSPPAPARSLAAAPRKRRVRRVVGHKQVSFPDENMISIAPKAAWEISFFKFGPLFTRQTKKIYLSTSRISRHLLPLIPHVIHVYFTGKLF